MLYRESVYRPGDFSPTTGLLFSKQRNGPTGMVPIRFRADLVTFSPAPGTRGPGDPGTRGPGDPGT